MTLSHALGEGGHSMVGFENMGCTMRSVLITRTPLLRSASGTPETACLPGGKGTMARANLGVGEDLRGLFNEALSEDSAVRWIRARIDEVVIRPAEPASGAATDSLEGDLRELDASTAHEPQYTLVCLDPFSPSKQWVLVALVPDDARVRAPRHAREGSGD